MTLSVSKCKPTLTELTTEQCALMMTSETVERRDIQCRARLPSISMATALSDLLINES